MVYKILENNGFGCEAHIFGEDLHNLYIAIKDAGQDGSYHNYQDLIRNK